jgi:hypothetical protein
VKRVYLILHIVAIPTYLFVTSLAFIMLMPPYLIVVFGGFDLWKRLVERRATYRLLWAGLVGLIQAFAFVLLVMGELRIIGTPVMSIRLDTAARFGAIFLLGFVLIAEGTTVFYLRKAVPPPRASALSASKEL